MSIELHIEELVLRGLGITPAQGARVQAMVEAELTRLIAEGGMRSDLASPGRSDGGGPATIPLSPAGSTRQIGTQIAAAVYQHIGEQQGTSR